MGIIAKGAIDRFLNRPLRDSSRVKLFSDKALDAKLGKLNPQPQFHTPLRTHQKACFLLGLKHPNYLFFLDMGLGKTLCVLSLFDYALQRGEKNRAIVLVPYGSNLAQWEQQVKEHTPHLTIAQVDGQGEGERWLQVKTPNADLVVITYAGFLGLVCQSKGEDEKGWKIDNIKLKRFADQFTFFIGDEFSQLCGRHDALTTRATKQLAWHCDYRYALTGTPYGKDPAALWSQLNCIDKGETLGETLGLFRAALFVEKPHYWAGKVWVFDERKKRILNRLLRHNSIRYRAEECLDLPEKTFSILPVTFDPETFRYYDELVNRIRTAEGDFQLLKSTFLNLRQLVSGYLTLRNDKGERQTIRFKNTPKIDAALDLIETIPSDKKIILFHEYRTTGAITDEKLTQRKIKHVCLNGQTKRKGEVVEKFLTDPSVRVLLSSSAGAFGLNLQIARYAIFVEKSCDPRVVEQEERRIWRIGSKHPVFYYSIIVKGSVDERIEASLRAGQDLRRFLVDGQTVKSLARK